MSYLKITKSMVSLAELLTDTEQRVIMRSKHRMILTKDYFSLTLFDLHVVAAVRNQQIHKAVKELANDLNELSLFIDSAYANR